MHLGVLIVCSVMPCVHFFLLSHKNSNVQTGEMDGGGKGVRKVREGRGGRRKKGEF